jgi:hypothetical protein
MKVTLLAKIVALLVFAFGAISFVNAYKNAKEPPKSFLVTYLITRVEDGQTPVVTGLGVRIVNAEGEWKETKVRGIDSSSEQVSVRFLDKTAPYKLEAGRLEYVGGTSEAEMERDNLARTPNWITSSPLFVREETMLGLKTYTTHQKLNNGWVDQAFSPVTRSTPLLYREHIGNVETTEEAVSVQFRDISPDEIRPPNLPISFEWLKGLEKAMLANPENADTVKRAIADREAVTAKLRALGRIE